jgi:hypothetical protein
MSAAAANELITAYWNWFWQRLGYTIRIVNNTARDIPTALCLEPQELYELPSSTTALYGIACEYRLYIHRAQTL